MILRVLLIAGFCLFTPSWGSMSPDDFESSIEPICFPNRYSEDPQLINGQEKSLSQTIENFISLTEKFEVANPYLGLQEELFYFIKSYVYDNIEFNRLGDIVRWEPKDAHLNEVHSFWEPDERTRNRQPEVEDPFSDAEKCSLFHMISHSIIRKSRTVDVERSATNEKSDNFYPMEIGVVAIQGTNWAVELGRVLKGMYVGLQSNRKLDLSSIPRIDELFLEGHQREIDRLYAITLSEVIAFATWRPEIGQRQKLAQDGYWVSDPSATNEEISDICPQIYRLKADESAAFSYSSVRGAADGLILGKIIDAVSSKNKGIKLSQILRQYYGGGGIFERNEELGGEIWASFCNRYQLIGTIEETLKEQTYLYQLLVTKNYKYFPDPFTWDYYFYQISKIFGIHNTAIRDFCTKKYSLDNLESFPRETPLDIIAVLDTTQGKEYIKKQQFILGYLAKELDLRYSGSRMTIFTDQRSSEDSFDLQSIVEDTFSSSCAACTVTQISLDDHLPTASEDDVINGINKYLNERKTKQIQKNGVNGKVVIYFKFKEEEESNKKPTPLQTKMKKALTDFRNNHLEVPIYVLGKYENTISKHVKIDGMFPMSAVDDPEKIIAKELLKRIMQVPATLQYSDCVDAKNENSAVFEYFVSPSAVQHWSLPAEFFDKNKKMKIKFQSRFGPIRVCHGREAPDPDLNNFKCEDFQLGQEKVIFNSRPCKLISFKKCAPLYFSVIGTNTTNVWPNDCRDTSENRCRTLDQVNFIVSHEGVRCKQRAPVTANA